MSMGLEFSRAKSIVELLFRPPYLGQIILGFPHTGHFGRTNREVKWLKDSAMALPNFS